MPIYPDKKNGVLTGRWRVEIQKDGKRRRGRFDSHAEAVTAEEVWKREPIPDVAPERRETRRRTQVHSLTEACALYAKETWPSGTRRREAITQIGHIAEILGDPSVVGIKRLNVSEVREELLRRGYALSTVNGHLSAFKSLLRVVKEDHPAVNVPTMGIQKPKNARIRVVSDEELEALFRFHLERGTSEFNKVILAYLMTGARLMELLDAKPEAISRHWLTVHGKRDKTRNIPTSPETHNLLRDIIPIPFSRSQVRRLWDAGRQHLGLDDDPQFVVHALRHSCATRLIKAQVNLAVVKDFMGHESIETTLRYVHVDDPMLLEAARIHGSSVAASGGLIGGVFTSLTTRKLAVLT
ncbi:tyrosine-type recombinase/integrase [Pyruvatibacter mobilis]|uniref:tyrosine-type recombinase/integrase n=1 Tax=Pyruvatibacter mobilis TaxID=1712261 RepID=UPI003BAB9501